MIFLCKPHLVSFAFQFCSVSARSWTLVLSCTWSCMATKESQARYTSHLLTELHLSLESSTECRSISRILERYLRFSCFHMTCNGRCMIYCMIKHGGPCLTTFPFTEKRIRSQVFLTNFEVFGNVVDKQLSVSLAGQCSTVCFEICHHILSEQHYSVCFNCAHRSTKSF